LPEPFLGWSPRDVRRARCSKLTVREQAGAIPFGVGATRDVAQTTHVAVARDPLLALIAPARDIVCRAAMAHCPHPLGEGHRSGRPLTQYAYERRNAIQEKDQMNQHKTEAAPPRDGDRLDEDRAAFAAMAQAVMAAAGGPKRPSAWSPAFCAAPCPDQWVGTVRFANSRLRYAPNGAEHSNDFSCRRPTSDLNAKSPRRLLMILESPHVREFGAPARAAKRGELSAIASGNLRPIGPAAGATGKNIRALLGEIAWIGAEQLIASPEGEDLDLVLINAIQHQTSLGHTTSHFRDKVFKTAWVSERLGRNNFQARLDKLWRAEPRDIVVNCCTVGKSPKGSLKHLVYDALREMADQNPLRPPLVVGCAHPSSWRRNKNNRVARVVALTPSVSLPMGGAHV